MKILAMVLVCLVMGAARAGACTLNDDQRSTLREAVTHLPHSSWSSLEEPLEHFIVNESIAAGYSPYDEIGVLQRLFDAGFDVHDAQLIERVIEELARAHAIDPHTALDAVLGAVHHHGERLAAMEPQLRPIIARDGTLQDVLRQIHHDDNWSVARESGQIALDRAHVMADMRCP